MTFCNLPFSLYHTHAHGQLAYPIYIEQPRAQPRFVSRSLKEQHDRSDLMYVNVIKHLNIHYYDENSQITRLQASHQRFLPLFKETAVRLRRCTRQQVSARTRNRCQIVLIIDGQLAKQMQSVRKHPLNCVLLRISPSS